MAASDAFYQGVIADIAPVFTALGRAFTVRGKATPSPATLTTTPGQGRSVTGIVADQQTARSMALGVVSWEATKTLILSHDANPQPGETIEVDGRWFEMDKLVAIKPADIVVVYMLDVT